MSTGATRVDQAFADCLARVRGSVEHRTIGLGSHSTQVIVLGSGPPVLLLHALGTDRRMWLPLASRLSERHRLILPDLRHHAGAKAAAPGTNLEDYAQDALRLLDALDAPRAIVGGISMGGAIAQHLALAAPERVERLWLIATIAKSFAGLIERAERGEQDGVAAQVEPTLERWFPPAALARNDWPIDYARATIGSMSPAGWGASWRALATVDSFARLPSITAPTRVIAGRADVSATPALMREIAERIPAARFHIIPDAGHLVALEAPQTLSELLES